MFKIGFLINPIAGMGGRVGLKGTDGVSVQKARVLRAKPVAIERARDFFHKLQSEVEDIRKNIIIVTCRGSMGASVASEFNFPVELISHQPSDVTTRKDTEIVCMEFVERKVDLVVFVGGDGTARDISVIVNSLSGRIPGFIGVPSGVKMFSGIFAVTPSAAAEIVKLYILGQTDAADFEIMDADEEHFRSNQFSIKLFGYLPGPYVPLKIQGAKQVSPNTDSEFDNQMGVARFVAETLGDDLVLIGPGTTTKAIASVLGKKKTLLGVDLYSKDEEFLDVNENQILENPMFNPSKCWIVVSPIGRQGIIFGRGNQQISPSIIRAILDQGGKERIIIAATKSKLESLEGKKLRIDSGDAKIDERLRGYLKAISDYMEWRMVQVI